MKTRRNDVVAPNVIGRADRSRGIWWVDDLGCWNQVDPQSRDRQQRRPFDGTPEHSWIAFTWLGLIKLQIRLGCITIKWNVRRVAPDSLASMLEFLGLQPESCKIRLSFYFDGWNFEEHPGPAAAIARIEQTSAYRNLPLISRMCLRPQDLAAVPMSAPLIRNCFEVWHKTKGSLDVSRHDDWNQLLPYLLLCKLRKSDDQLIFAGIGKKADCTKVYSRGWLRSAPSQRYDHRHPGDFSDRTAEPYPQVLESGEPRLDHIRTVVPRETREPVWAPYQRLLLPVRLRDGTPAVVSAGKLTQYISIPFLAA